MNKTLAIISSLALSCTPDNTVDYKSASGLDEQSKVEISALVEEFKRDCRLQQDPKSAFAEAKNDVVRSNLERRKTEMPKNALQQNREKVGKILDAAGCKSTGAMWCNFNNEEYPSITQIWVIKNTQGGLDCQK